MKTKITVFVSLFMFGIMSINAQIDKPINNKIDLNKIKPNYRGDLKITQGGLQGFVFNHDGEEKIGSVEIIFENIAGGPRKEIITEKYGNFKIALKMEKYRVYGLKDGYIPYVSHPGYSVVDTKFKAFNIYLDKNK